MTMKPIWSLSQIISQLDYKHWDNPRSLHIDPSTGATTIGPQVITYTMDGVPRESPRDSIAAQNILPMSADEQSKAAAAFELWDDLIAACLDPSHDRNADISFNYTTFRDEGTGKFARTDDYDARLHGTIEQVDIWVPEASVDRYGDSFSYRGPVSYGDFTFFTYVHEIGHSLGLNHPGEYGLPNPNNIDEYNYANRAHYAQDSVQFTIMSYWKETATGTGANYSLNGERLYPQTPMLHDVAAIQAMYGADLETRTGNTVYGFNSSFPVDGVGSVYNFTTNKNPILTIYDAGGDDTLDVSGFKQNQIIDLRPGHYSSIGALKNNVAMAFNATSGSDGHASFNPNAVIENAVGGAGNDTITGNDADNILKGGAGADVLYGGAGNDTLDGGSQGDMMYGGAGNDTYVVDSLNDVVDETAFVSRHFYADTGGDQDIVLTSLSRFDLTPLSHNATFGNSSSNVSGLFADLTYPTASVYGVVENLTYTGTGTFYGRGNAADNVITGGAKDDKLYGLDGNDTLYGGDGNDLLDGGSQGDMMYGGAGNDTYVVDSLYDVVDEEVFVGGGPGGVMQLYADAGGDQDLVRTSLSHFDLTPASHNSFSENTSSGLEGPLWDVTYPPLVYGLVEDLTYTGTGAFYGRGNAANNIITGGAKDDILDGGDGNDTLYGLGGNDTLRGGAGNDTLYGGAGADTYSHADGWGQDTIIGFELGSDIIDMKDVNGLTSFGQFTITDTTQGAKIAFGGDSITLKGISASQLTTASFQFSDITTMSGGDGADTLIGDNGRNHLMGLAGDDVLIGNGNADNLDGGTGTDTANYAASLAGVTVDLSTGTGHGGDAEGDTLISIEHVIGSAFDDTFRGGADRGQFLAGDGNDTMVGGSVYDWLEGGNGNDTFIGTGGSMVMFGGDGDDMMTGSLNNTNYFDGGAGNDIMIGGNTTDYMADVTGGDDIMYGGGGDDVLDDWYGVTQLFGEDGDDFMTAIGGSGVLDGGAGNDYVTVANGDYMLFGGTGDDTLEAAGYGTHIFTGNDGADIFTYRVGSEQPTIVTDFEDGVDRIYLWDEHSTATYRSRA